MGCMVLGSIMYCPHPFSRVEIKANGDVYCCCEGWLPKSLGNILEASFDAIWQGKVAAEIRRTVVDGSFRYCTACPYLPGPGGPVVADSLQSSSLERIATLKLDYDQSCNLACPSCRTAHSSKFVDLPKVQRIHDAVLASGILERVDQLYVTGAGDPFASPVYWPMLQNFPVLKSNSNLKLFLHTNGQLFDVEHWEAMSSIQSRVTDVGISVDAACEKTYRLNRRSSWSHLWDNIDFINALQESRPITLGMFFTVQANNFREILPFVRMAFNHNVSWVSITALRNWGTYTKDEYRERAVHLPGHPLHADFREIICSRHLTDNRKIVLDSFDPNHAEQTVIGNAEALLPAARLIRT
jgi:radical SAM protein with 4Fe4S-binding SPASM domain